MSAARLQQIDVDEYGAPVTFGPARWLVCFVPGLRSQMWHRFVHPTHKHVLMLRVNADGTWTLFEPWWTRILIRTISADQAVKYLRWATMGDALLVEEHVPGAGSQIRGWSNCASLAGFVLGRPYAVWSPHGLFKRLLSEPHTRRIDVGAFVNRYRAGGWPALEEHIASLSRALQLPVRGAEAAAASSASQPPPSDL